MWNSHQCREDMVATANHEAVHCRQFAAIRDNIPTNNVWRRIAVSLGMGQTSAFWDFAEAEAHLSELLDTNVGWYHAISATQGDLFNFHHHFTNAVKNGLPQLGGTARDAARTLLQNMYRNIPFEEMKRDGYDHHVRPPQ
jgi:hypothetical protein